MKRILLFLLTLGLAFVALALTAVLAVVAAFYFSPELQRRSVESLLNQQEGVQAQVGHAKIRWGKAEAGQVFVFHGRNGYSVDRIDLEWSLWPLLRYQTLQIDVIDVDNFLVDLTNSGRGAAVVIRDDQRLPTGSVAGDDEDVVKQPAPARTGGPRTIVLEEPFGVPDFLFGPGGLSQLSDPDQQVVVSRINAQGTVLLPGNQIIATRVSGKIPGARSTGELEINYTFEDPNLLTGWRRVEAEMILTSPLNRRGRPEELAVNGKVTLSYPRADSKEPLRLGLNSRWYLTANGEALDFNLDVAPARAPVLGGEIRYNVSAKSWQSLLVLASAPPGSGVLNEEPVRLSLKLNQTGAGRAVFALEVFGQALHASQWSEFLQALVPGQQVDAGLTDREPPAVAVSPTRPSVGTAPPQPTLPRPPVSISFKPPQLPIWHGWTGMVSVRLQRIYWEHHVVNGFQLDAQLAENELRFPGSFSYAGGTSDWQGAVKFSPEAEAPYTFNTTLKGSGFDAEQLLTAVSGGSSSLWQGIFDFTGELQAESPTMANLADSPQGKLRISSTQGTIYPLGEQTQRADSVQSLLSGLGAFVGGLRRATSAGEELLRQLREMPYHRLHVEIERGANMNFVLRELDIVSRETRLSGSGVLLFNPALPFAENGLDLTMQLSAKGVFQDKLQDVQLAGAMPDALGFFPGPKFQISGKVGAPKSSLADLLLQAIRNSITGQ